MLVAALRLSYLFSGYVLGWDGFRLHHVQAAAAIFASLGLVTAALNKRREFSDGFREPGVGHGWVMWPVAVLLFWPSLSVSFLSDDFVLLKHAASWHLGPVTPELFRPLPLFLWSVLIAAGATATAFHAVNLILHLANAYLVGRIVRRWTPEPGVANLAGALFLTSPIAVEPVVWASGIFDVMATTLALSLILVARRYTSSTPPSIRLTFFSIGVLALASKETAAVAPILVLVDSWVLRRLDQAGLRRDAFALSLVMALYGAARLFSASDDLGPSGLSRYSVQALIFGTFGGLSAPWSSESMRLVPAVAGMHSLIVTALFTLYFITSGSRERLRAIVGGGALLALIPLLPVFPFSGVGADLQGSRYLYMATLGWAGLVALVVGDLAQVLGRSGRGIWLAVTLLVAGACVQVRIHLLPWADSSVTVAAAQIAAARDLKVPGCDSVVVTGLPDSVRGAYAFRNGTAEALSLKTAAVGTVPSDCAFYWDSSANSFRREGR